MEKEYQKHLKAIHQKIIELQPIIERYQSEKLSVPHFDNHLFHNYDPTMGYEQYFQQIEKNYSHLVKSFEKISADNSCSHYLDKIAYITESLIAQIASLQRAVATQQLKNKHIAQFYSGESLAQKHARHLNYLRKLEEQKFELQSLSPVNKIKISQLQGRIVRCQQAIIEIEKQIEQIDNQ